MEDKILLEMTGISKSFPGVKALDKVNLTVKAGSVHALMGENGAGKSTLMKCLFSIYNKDEGLIELEGKEINFRNPKDAMEHGVAMVHQELNQVQKRNVMDNMWLGRFPMMANKIFVSEKKMYEYTKALFDDLEIDMDPKALVSDLSISKRQMLEIAKAVSYEAKILVLDEPTSSLTVPEVKHLFKIINKLRDRGCGIIYISHKMDEILEISDEITIMRDGQYISTDNAKDLTMTEIIKKMVGRELTNLYPPKTNIVGDVLLKCENLTAKYGPSIQNVSFDLKKGEIIGLAGLVGSRRTELMESIFGMRALETGSIFVNGVQVHNKSPKIAIANKFALITEERRHNGIFGVLSIKENTAITNLKKYKNKAGFLDNKMMVEDTNWSVNSMNIKTPTINTKIKTLSGGNQQKVIIGRWLLTTPDILMLDEPTRGIDVGAKYEIYKLIIDLASEGKSVLMVSSEMGELMGICDRILVMSNGKLAGELDAKTATQEEIMTLAAMYV